jgi:uncharacterized protein YcbK (DUF882 family)
MQVDFMIKLQKVRDIYGKPMQITSGFRCAKHNLAVGGSPTSQHMLGLAADIQCGSFHDRYALINAAFAVGMRGIGVYRTFVHMDLRKGEPSMWRGG